MLLLVCGLAACAESPVLPTATTPGECPNSLQAGVRLTASVAQVPIPGGVQVPSGGVRLIAGVGRRILLSLEVPEPMPRVRLLANSLAVSTYGGILAGWAQAIQPAGATAHESIQVSGDFLRIAPFVPGRRLRTYTQTIDVVVIPGGAPVSGLALRPGPMWDDAGKPTAPDRLTVVLDPILHMAELTTVEATARFDFTALQRSGNYERWECSVQSDFQLVDHASVLPSLWTLQSVERVGARNATLALYNQHVGAFPAVFLDPATAAGFARWLGESRATRVGEYEIGLMATGNATGFQAARNEGLVELAVRQLGSD
jgi:hypothetical protein